MSNRRISFSIRRLIIPALVLIGAWLGINAILDHQPSTDTIAALVRASGDSAPPAPDFVLTTIDGDKFRLADHRGRVVVLNFWATWCAPCRYEIPDFIRLQDEFGMTDVVFAGVSTERRNRAGVVHFANEMGINYPIMVDDGAADNAYGPIMSMPTTYLIDRDGNIRAYIPGMISRQMLEPALDIMVAQSAEVSFE